MAEKITYTHVRGKSELDGLNAVAVVVGRTGHLDLGGKKTCGSSSHATIVRDPTDNDLSVLPGKLSNSVPEIPIDKLSKYDDYVVLLSLIQAALRCDSRDRKKRIMSGKRTKKR